MKNEHGLVQRQGVGAFGLLAIAFIVLKLTGHIDWSWWWILSPLWMPMAILGFVLFLLGIVTLVREW